MSTFENKKIILEHLNPQESFLYMTVEVGVPLNDEEKELHHIATNLLQEGRVYLTQFRKDNLIGYFAVGEKR